MANMADESVNKDITSLKKTKIQVFVDEALPDILVVTYEFGVKIFKGVLLDSTKRNLPCGVPNLNPAFEKPPKNLDDDTLYSVNQRFAYTDPSAPKKKNIEMPRKYKTNKISKMTVRLRPRQVLCSKCKGICNENSENVSKKNRSAEGGQNLLSLKRGSNAPITRSVQSIVAPDSGRIRLGMKRKLRGNREAPTMVPKLTRLTPAEEDAIANGTYVDTTSSSKKPLSNASNSENTRDNNKHSLEHSDSGSESNNSEPSSIINKAAKRGLRKKRSTESIEDIWEEPVFNEKKGKNPQNSAQAPDSRTSEPITTNTRTIKISYGPQGEGTVLKIPAQLDSLDSADFAENVNIDDRANKKGLNNKAARRALKRAKKEARRKILLSGGSPMYLGGTSPRYGLSSPRYTVGSASPRHGLGGNSPRYMMPPFDTLPRRRKHKMKHKKRHREDKDRKHKEGEVSSTQEDPGDQLITQKLSISLKRLNDSSYTPCPPPADRDAGSSDEHGGEAQGAPDFPPPNQPLVLRLNEQAVPGATGSDGARLLVGDVVWGKIHGFPWWPGKILTITSYGGTQAPQAHVSWYGSSTSSFMRCDQLDLYLDNFKIRYNKQKKGAYKEAIKQATVEAQENAENRVRQPLGNSPSHNIMVSPPLASPREIDVAS